MKDCKEIIEQISLYIDNQLDDIKRMEFEEHIRNCDDCCNEFEQIMHITSICSEIDEVELPDNFKQQLHEKLIIEKEKSQKELKIKNLNSRYMKVFSAIAALLLIAVLIKGFLGNGYFMPPFTEKSSTKESVAEAPQALVAEDKSAVSNYNGNVNMEKAQQFSINSINESNSKADNDVLSQQESSRSLTATAKRSSTTALASDSVNGIYNSNIIIRSENPEKQVDNIRTIALANEAELANNDEVFGLKESEKQVNLNEFNLVFKVKNSKYSSFMDSLKNEINNCDIEPGEVKLTDVSEQINALNQELGNLDSEIENQENTRNISNPEKLEELKAERENIRADIEKINTNLDYTFVNLIVIKK